MVFGKNLKKIRKVHGLSQQDFAELFDLKRGTLGAYEEDRSNPKLETVIKIANHFSITLDELLTRELTINDLLRFNEAMTTAGSMPATPDFEGVACIIPEVEQSFLNEYRTSHTVGSIYLPYIRIPNISGANKLAYVVNDLLMSGEGDNLLPKDMVIGESVPASELLSISGKLAILITDNSLFLRTIEVEGDKCALKANHPGVADLVIENKKITGLYKVLHIFRYTLPEAGSELEQRLALLEKTIASISTNPKME